MSESAEPLLERIAKTPPRETGGSTGANRSDYQKSWTFCLLLTLHEKPNDYALLLDFHDDVVVLDSAVSPTDMEFFQIKSKSSGAWTITQLLKCPKGKNGTPGKSICGKMYANKLAFPNVTKAVNFITNARFRIRLKGDPEKDTEVEKFDLQELAQEISGQYFKALQMEHGLKDPLAEVATNFRSDPLACEGHREQAQGLFASFLDKKKPGGKFAVAAAFRAIASVIAKKSGAERRPTNRDELLQLKTITRADFSGMLEDVMKEDEADRWGEINSALLAANYPFGQIRRFRSAWNKYDVQRMDAANAPLQQLKDFTAQILSAFVASTPDFDLRSLIEHCVPELRQRLGAASPFDEDYLTSVLLYHCHENKPLPAPIA